MYFYYGITNSLLENQSEEIELTVDTHYITPEKVDSNRLGIYFNHHVLGSFRVMTVYGLHVTANSHEPSFL